MLQIFIFTLIITTKGVEQSTMQLLLNLERLMADYRINRSELARACNLSTSTVNSWWNRSCENISLQTLMKLANYFNVSLEELVNGPSTTELIYTIKDYSDEELQAIDNFAKFIKLQRKD